jgi:hypothetical protein
MATPISLTTDQELPLTLSPLSQLGNPATVISPLWSSSNISAVSLSIANNGLSCLAIGAGVGQSTISCIANADLTGGAPVQVSGSIVINVTSAQAASLSLVTGAVTLQ